MPKRPARAHPKLRPIPKLPTPPSVKPILRHPVSAFASLRRRILG